MPTLRASCHPLLLDPGVPAVVRALRRRGPVVALESCLVRPGQAPRHLVAGAPLACLSYRAGAWEIHAGREPPDRLCAALAGNPGPFAGLKAALDALALEVPAGSPPLGAFGFFGYECQAPSEAAPDSRIPDAWFLLTDTAVEWSGTATPRIWSCDPELRSSLAAGPWRAPRPPSSPQPLGGPELFRPGDFDRGTFGSVFREIKGSLRRGDSYQLCFTYPLCRSFEADPLLLYEDLRQSNPAPFAAYLEAPTFAVVSSSPERFLKVDPEGGVVACPMKGTRARGCSTAEDRQIRAELRSSAKDRAENLMIADLLRNDLGRVCRLGSVRITDPAALEEFATVFQLISRVEGRLRSDRTWADLLGSCFPPGSMTGAPKVRSMQLLHRLEARRRGPYSGALGYLSTSGEIDLSVLIRSWVVAAGEARCGVGGGVIWDSSADGEFDETRIKARALLSALERVRRAGARPRFRGEERL